MSGPMGRHWQPHWHDREPGANAATTAVEPGHHRRQEASFSLVFLVLLIFKKPLLIFRETVLCLVFKKPFLIFRETALCLISSGSHF
jgi:hypothetical protein